MRYFAIPNTPQKSLMRLMRWVRLLGMVPAGLAALDMLRIEAGLIFAGSEFDDDHRPHGSGG